MIIANTIKAALQNTEELDFLEVFALLIACFDFVYEFDLRIFVNCIYFEEIGANAVMFFGPNLD